MPYAKSKETRNSILNAARTLFAQNGFEKTSVRKIAEFANLSNQGSIYYYFKSKEEIMTEIYTDYFSQIVDTANCIIGDDSDPLLFCFVSMKLHFGGILQNDASKNAYLSIIDSDIVNDKIMIQNYRIFEDIRSKYNITVSRKILPVYVYATRGSEIKLLKGKIRGELRIDDGQLIDYIIGIYPSLLGITKDTVSFYIKKADELLSDRTVFSLL